MNNLDLLILVRTLRNATPPAGPSNTAAPEITGFLVDRATLSCSTGTWTGTGEISYAYQWRRGNTPISGATSSTYTLQAADVGTVPRCVVSATDDNGTRTKIVTASGAVEAAEFDLYVDSENGSDANDGESIDKPLATLGALPTLTAGIAIGLARDSHWREQLVLPANDITIKAYGEGDKPLIDASDPIDSEDWSLADTTTNVYQASVTLPDIGSVGWVNVWEDDVGLPKATSLANCDETPGSYWVTANTGSITLYVHPTDSTNPTSDGKTYEVTKRAYGIFGESRSGCTVEGVRTRRNLHQDGSLWLGKFSSIIDCDADDGSKHNAFVRGGSVVRGLSMSGAYYGTGQLIMLIAYEDTPTGDDLTFIDCSATLPAFLSTSSAFGCHNSTSGLFGTVSASGCVVSNVGTAYNFTDCSAIEVIESTASNVNVGLSAEADALVDGCTFNTLQSSVIGGVANIAVTLRDSTFSNSTFPTSTFRALNVNDVSLDMQGCTVTSSNGWMIQMTGNRANLYLRNNTFQAVTNGYFDIEDSDYTLDSDYNTFGAANKGGRFVGVTYSTVSAYVAAIGQDTHSTY